MMSTAMNREQKRKNNLYLAWNSKEEGQGKILNVWKLFVKWGI